MKNDYISVELCSSYRVVVRCWWFGVCLWRLERVVDAVIRLYLKAYKPVELAQLYQALHMARAMLSGAVKSHPVCDLDEALVYLAGYMDAKGESAK